MDSAHKNLTDFVGDFVNEPTTMPWGNRSLLFRDPDGDLVNFFTPVTPAAIENSLAEDETTVRGKGETFGSVPSSVPAPSGDRWRRTRWRSCCGVPRLPPRATVGWRGWCVSMGPFTHDGRHLSAARGQGPGLGRPAGLTGSMESASNILRQGRSALVAGGTY